MKNYWSLPKSEAAKAFFARYAKPVKYLRGSSFLGQFLSGGTEGVILYGLFLAAFMTLLPNLAVELAVVGAAVSVFVIELAVRLGLIYSIRAIVRKRWKGKDLAMTILVMTMTVVFVPVGTLLSVYGADDGVKAISTPPPPAMTDKVDSLANVRVAAVQRDWDEEKGLVLAEITPRIQAAEAATASEIDLLNRRISDLGRKERKEKKRYTTMKNELRTRKQEVETRGVQTVTAIQKEKSNQLATLRAKYKPMIDTLRSDQLAAVREIEEGNAVDLQEWEDQVEGYGTFLGVVVIAFMLLLIVSITADEIHKAGSEMEEQVEPGAFEFEEGMIKSLRLAIAGRFESWVRAGIWKIERGTRETKEPVRAPIIWERKRDHLNARMSEAGSTRRPASTKLMKWEHKETEPLYCTPTTSTKKEDVRVPLDDTETMKEEARTETYTIREKHRGMNISDLTQRLKDYKKRLGGHQQKARVQEKEKGKVSRRTAEAIENNQHWVGYFEELIRVAKTTPEKTVPKS